jgi:hypothetical protein
VKTGVAPELVNRQDVRVIEGRDRAAPPQNDLYKLGEFGTLRPWSARRDSGSGWRPCCHT